jgi:transposase
VQVLAALTEGVGINAATRLYGVSKNSIYRWQERLSGLKKRSFNTDNAATLSCKRR